MNEMANPAAIQRRIFQGILPLHGHGLDVGAGPPEWGPWWAGLKSMTGDRWDRPQGDAHTLAGVPDGHYDWLSASHILEHLQDPERALRSWLRVVKPGAPVLIVVPHRTLYERQEGLPSRWNPAEHLRYYLPYLDRPQGCTVGLFQWLRALEQPLGFRLEKLVTGDWGNTNTHLLHQHPNGEYQIDALVRKMPQCGKETT